MYLGKSSKPVNIRNVKNSAAADPEGCRAPEQHMKKNGKITINDIAEMAGVSKTTVSFYLNGKTEKMSEDTRLKIGSLIRQNNYSPNIAARILNAKQTHLIGVIIGDITNTFSNQIVKGIEENARAKGCQMLVGNSSYNSAEEEGYVEKMLMLGVDGFIIQPTSQFKKISDKIAAEHKPLVFFDSKLYESSTCWVKTDNYEATYHAIKECIRKGYRRFVMIGANPSLLSTRIERSSGFIDALEESSLPYDSLELKNSPIDLASVTAFVKKHMHPGEPLLVYVPNCWALPSVFTALQEYRSQIPGQLGIIGFDNTEWASFSDPRVTTIVQPAYQEGETACSILIDQIEKTCALDQQKTLSCTVNWSGSTR